MSLKVTLIQSNLVWEDITKNLEMFSGKLTSIGKTDIIILPEMFTTGFTMNAANLAETEDGGTIAWLKKSAKQYKSAIVGSIIYTNENGKFFNRLIWAFPNGEIKTYDKRHLFRMAEEHHTFSAGNSKLIVEYKGWKICPLICYDLRFPVWSRNNKANSYDCLIYIANWPAVRKEAWSKLLLARAIENQVYVIGVNRIGEDGKGILYAGNSIVVNPKGEEILVTKEYEEEISSCKLSLEELHSFREKFPVGEDADDFIIN